MDSTRRKSYSANHQWWLLSRILSKCFFCVLWELKNSLLHISRIALSTHFSIIINNNKKFTIIRIIINAQYMISWEVAGKLQPKLYTALKFMTLAALCNGKRRKKNRGKQKCFVFRKTKQKKKEKVYWKTYFSFRCSASKSFSAIIARDCRHFPFFLCTMGVHYNIIPMDYFWNTFACGIIE